VMLKMTIETYYL